MMHIATLRKLIDKHGSQTGFARHVGMGQGHLSDILSGKRPVGLALAFKLEDKCGIDGLGLLEQQLEHAWREHKMKQRKE